jgi:hypothetical protein
MLKAGLAQDVGTRSASLGVTGSRLTLIPFALEPRYRTPHCQHNNRDCSKPLPHTQYVKHLAKVRLDPKRVVPLEGHARKSMPPANAVAGTVHSLIRVFE